MDMGASAFLDVPVATHFAHSRMIARLGGWLDTKMAWMQLKPVKIIHPST